MTITDFFEQAVGVSVQIPTSAWIRMTNNSTATSYVSSAATDASGRFTINNIPIGSYTVSYGPSATGPWTNVGDANYIVASDGSNASIPLAAVSGAAADSAVVHLAGAETLTGVKTVPALSVSGLTGAVAGGRFVGYTAYGSPSTGTFSVGDSVISKASGSTFVCTVAGTPGTWVAGGQLFNVLDYGADATGVADSSPSINAAVSAAGFSSSLGKGGVIYFPPGSYKLASTITVQNGGGNAGLTFWSPTWGSAFLYPTAALNAADIFNVNATAGQINNIWFVNLNINGAPTPAAGNNVIHFRNANQCGVKDCFINGGYIGVNIDTATNNTFVGGNQLILAGQTNRGILVGGASKPNGVQLVNIQFGAPGAGGPTAIELQNVAGLNAYDIDATGGWGYGLLVNPAAGQTVDWTFWSQCQFDSCSSIGVWVRPAGSFRGSRFVDCWAASNNQGVLYQSQAGGLIDDVKWIGGHFQNNAAYGVRLDGANGTSRNIWFTDCSAVNNGTASNNTYQGLEVLNGFSGFHISGGKYGYANINSAACMQQYGITIPAASTDFTILGADVQGNVTGGVNNLSTAPGVTAYIRGCPGYNPTKGLVATPAFPATGITTTNNTAVDQVAYITNGAGALTIQVDNVASLMVIPASATGTVRIPAGSTFTPSYAAGVPTWKWYGE